LSSIRHRIQVDGCSSHEIDINKEQCPMFIIDKCVHAWDMHTVITPKNSATRVYNYRHFGVRILRTAFVGNILNFTISAPILSRFTI
jgi:hypothetical protein